MEDIQKYYTGGEIKKARQFSSMGLIIRQKEPTNLETPFDQLDCFSLRRSCSTYAVISRPRSQISPPTNCASMVRPGIRFL